MQRYTKIQLITPPSNRTVEGQQKWARWPQPIGLMSIATYVNQSLPGVMFELLDFDCIYDLDNPEHEKLIGNCELVGLSITFAQIDRGLEIAKIAKGRNADVMIGGNIATAINERIMRYHDYIDYCICHDGEEAVLRLLRGDDYHQIPNMVWREDGIVRKNPSVHLDLRSLPIIDRGYIDFEAYIGNAKDEDFMPLPQFSRPANMYSQKGCTWRASKEGGCMFCSIHDKGHRARDPKQVWEERKYLVNEYNVNYIWDPSDNFVANYDWFKALYDCKPKDFIVPFSNYIRADYVTDEIARMLHEIGCVQVFMGMESGSDEALKAHNKGISKKIIENALKIMKKNHITVVFGLVIGAIGEKQENLIETLEFVKYLLDTYSNLDRFEWGTLAPLPGSKAFNKITQHPELKEKYQDFGKGHIMSSIEQMVEDWPDYMCSDGVDFEYILHLQQIAQEHLPYRMTRYQKRAWTGTAHKAYINGNLVINANHCVEEE